MEKFGALATEMNKVIMERETIHLIQGVLLKEVQPLSEDQENEI